MKTRFDRKTLFIYLGNLLPFVLLKFSIRFCSVNSLFWWLSKHNFWYIWVIVVVLLLCRRYIAASFLTAGNLAGALIGEYLGNFLRALRMEKITPDMSGMEVAYLSQNYGWLIWIITALVFLILGLVLQFCFKRAKRI